MKTIATKMMTQVIATLTVSDIIYALLPSLVLVLIVIVFAIDLYNYTKLLEKRMELNATLSIMKALIQMERNLTNTIRMDSEDIIKKIQETLNSVNYKIENYKGLSKHILGLFGVK